MDLQQYDRVKLELADILRSATMRPVPDSSQEMVRDLFGRLAEDRFNLVVVGRFSRGKTSLMNAMLGTDKLPTGMVPVTSVITTVTYGTDEQVVLDHQHTNLFLEISIAQLVDHITERGNPGNMRRIRTAEVQLPAELLRRGFHFIDTPGLGSSIIENTRTTEAFLPEADALILVTSYDSPLSEEELRTLQTIHASGRRVFIVVNKQDCADPSERQEVIDHLQSQLPSIFGESLPPIFSVSAQQALDARLLNNGARLAKSGLRAFETALLNFLVNYKRQEFLLNMCTRIGAILGNPLGSEDDAARLTELRREVEFARPSAQLAEPLSASTANIASDLPSCEICARVTEATFNFVAQYQYQLRGDHKAQVDLAERHGLCAWHTSLFEAVAAPGEVCSGFAGVMERQAGHLREAARAAPSGAIACQAVSEALPTAQTCPVCGCAQLTTHEAIRSAANRLTHDPTVSLGNLSAICLPHLRLLVSALGNSPLVKDLLLREADILDRLAEDMRRFVLKRDAVRRHLTSKEEAAAAHRSLRILIGHPSAQIGPGARPSVDAVTAMIRRAG